MRLDKSVRRMSHPLGQRLKAPYNNGHKDQYVPWLEPQNSGLLKTFINWVIEESGKNKKANECSKLRAVWECFKPKYF